MIEDCLGEGLVGKDVEFIGDVVGIEGVVVCLVFGGVD